MVTNVRTDIPVLVLEVSKFNVKVGKCHNLRFGLMAGRVGKTLVLGAARGEWLLRQIFFQKWRPSFWKRVFQPAYEQASENNGSLGTTSSSPCHTGSNLMFYMQGQIWCLRTGSNLMFYIQGQTWCFTVKGRKPRVIVITQMSISVSWGGNRMEREWRRSDGEGGRVAIDSELRWRGSNILALLNKH